VTPDLPLVSCIMPTFNRRAFVPLAIRYFLRQNYPNKELIVVDDGSDNIGDLVPTEQSVRYYHLNSRLTLGAKPNFGCRQPAERSASAEMTAPIAHFWL
jgi:cellulose synthase/poly-beta-1,6-N-acetylglucosamine synthase-like glycosyltransferase